MNDGILIGLCASAYYCYYIAIVCVVIDSGGFSFYQVNYLNYQMVSLYVKASHHTTFEIVSYSLFYAYHILLFVFHVAHSMAVLRIGSMEVGALLNDAYKEFEVTSMDVPCLMTKPLKRN